VLRAGLSRAGAELVFMSHQARTSLIGQREQDFHGSSPFLWGEMLKDKMEKENHWSLPADKSKERSRELVFLEHVF
jgi:hypothetical protein